MEKEVGQESQFAVVTGASSGIGRELAQQLAEHGFDLLITGQHEGIFAAEEDLRATGVLVQAVQLDLTKYKNVEALYKKIQESGRDVDVLMVNAGVGVGGDFATQTSLEDELKLISLNVLSSVHLVKRVVKDMVTQGRGKILFTSLVAATMPGTFEAVYAASKAFIQSFSQALRNEVADHGVTVTALMPGPVETNFFHRAGMDDTNVGTSEKDNAHDVAKIGFDAMMAGKDHVVASSLMSQAMAAVGRVLPDTTLAQMHRKLSEPGSGRKN